MDTKYVGDLILHTPEDVAAHAHITEVTGPEDIWSGGGLYPWMTGATSLEVVSTSANDTAAGAGARTIQINGLDAGRVF